MLRLTDLTQRAALSGWHSSLARVVGVLAILGAAGLVLAGYLPYLVLAGTPVAAPVTPLGVAAQAVYAAPLLAGGSMLVLCRGGKSALALVSPAAAAAVGTAVVVSYQTSAPNAHPAIEFYFGRGHSTASIQAQVGHTITFAASIALIGALVGALIAWRGADDPSGAVPLGRERAGAAGFAISAGVLAAVALLFPPAVGVIRTAMGADGIEVVVPVGVPAGTLDSSGWALVGGLTVAFGVLVVGLAVAVIRSRPAMVAGLVGLGCLLASMAMVNFRDIAQNVDLVPGIGTYALLVAAVLAAAGVIYLARVRREDDDGLGSGAAERLGVLEEELV